MTDWAGWGTAVGTLVLAGATFAAVRSSSRAARVAERTLLAGLRPVLAPARPSDPAEQVQFADGRVFAVGDGRALVAREDAVVYLAIPLRNVGAGIAVLRGYHLEAESAEQAARDPRGVAGHRKGDTAPDPEDFAEQQRDLYIPVQAVGFWQAALRDPSSELFADMIGAIRTQGRLTADVLYTDHGGGQPTITRFVLRPDGGERWRCDVTRHWTL